MKLPRTMSSNMHELYNFYAAVAFEQKSVRWMRRVLSSYDLATQIRPILFQ